MCQLLRKNLIFVLIFVLAFGWTSFTFSQQTIIETTVRISICGNNVIDEGEVCDGTDLAGKTCQDFGYTHGTLVCSPACDAFDISGCYTPPAAPPSGRGGGAPPLETKVIFSGRAYPESQVTLLKDAQIAATTVAGPDAKFYISLSGLSAGNYIFSLYSEDNRGQRSSLLTFPIYVTAGVTTHVSGIFIAPTIDVDKSEVKKGDIIVIFGQSTAESEITIVVSSQEEIFLKTSTDKDGVYLHNFDTVPLSMGQHHTKSRSAIEGEISPYSKTVGFLVGTKNVLKEKPGILMGDLNKDGRVNLVDFSIAAYWYRRTLSSTMKEIECERLNCDGIINLVDFSIMAYYWTG